MAETVKKVLGGGKDKAASRARDLAARSARASSARQLSAAARDAALADKTSGRGGRKKPGSNAFGFLTGPSETLG